MVGLERNMLPRKNLFIAGTLAVGLMSLGQFCSADAISDSQIGQLTMVKFLVGLSRFITWPDSSFLHQPLLSTTASPATMTLVMFSMTPWPTSP